MAATATAALDEVERHVQRPDHQTHWRAEDAVFRARGILKAIEIVGASELDTVADALYSLRGALDTLTAEAVGLEEEVHHG